MSDPVFNSIRQRKGIKEIDASGLVAFPGFIDCHTHPVFGGNRAAEFAMKIAGKTYLEIAKAGGGINRSVNHTRQESMEDLANKAKKTFTHMFSWGVTTIEAKSGYGLDTDNEIKSLQAIRSAQDKLPVEVIPTFLGAHAFPLEYKDKPDEYVQLVCDDMLPLVHQKKLSNVCDIFIEEGFFSVNQARKILQKACDLGMRVKVHADEFTCLKGTELAIEFSALSVEHLEFVSEEGIKGLVEKNIPAVLLPGTSYYCNLPYAPARKILQKGCSVAIASDFNPGSCVCDNLFIIMNMAATQMKMQPYEIIAATTYNAAKALGLEGRLGSIEIGKQADIVLFEIPQYSYLIYHFGRNFARKIIKNGNCYENKLEYSTI